MQRAEVLAFAQTWKRDATGGVTIDRPVGSANERAADDTLKEALSIIVQAGVPNNGIGIRPYHADGEQARDAAAQLSADGGGGRPLRPVARRSRAELRPEALREQAILELRLRDAAQSRRDGRRTRPTSCSRAPKRRSIPPSAPSASTSGARAKARRRTIRMTRQGRDQRFGQMIRTALQTVTPEAAPAEPAAARRAHRAGAARLGPGVLRDRRDRGRDPGRRRGSPPGQGASQDPDGRHHRRDRSLSRLADAQRHHARVGGPRRRAS